VAISFEALDQQELDPAATRFLRSIEARRHHLGVVDDEERARRDVAIEVANGAVLEELIARIDDEKATAVSRVGWMSRHEIIGQIVSKEVASQTAPSLVAQLHAFDPISAQSLGAPAIKNL
jgi:hypothetical protein